MCRCVNVLIICHITWWSWLPAGIKRNITVEAVGMRLISTAVEINRFNRKFQPWGFFWRNNCWAQLAFTDLFTTKADCVVVSAYMHSFQRWLLHLRSMCGALSDPPHKGHVAGPVVLPNRLVCLSVCIVSVLYLRTCSCSLKVTLAWTRMCWWARGFALGCCVWELGCAARSGVSCKYCQSL